MNKIPLTFKIIIFGDSNVGKSRSIKKYIPSIFSEETGVTLGVDLSRIDVEVDGKKVKLQWWRLNTEDRWNSLTTTYLQGTNGAILMYDMTNSKSLDQFPKWVQLIRDYWEEVPIFMVGYKADLVKNRKISTDKAKKLSKRLGFNGYIECSFITGENISDLFELIAKTMLAKYFEW